MEKTFALILLFCAATFAQQKFEMKNASANYDVRIEVERCDDTFCEGAMKVELFRKPARKPFQVFNLGETNFLAEEARMSGNKLMYDYQSVVFLEDYNFDGAEDLAIRDGNNSGYGGPSYQIYLFAPRGKKFVRNQTFTDLAQNENLGMFEVDEKRQLLRTFSKSGCCWHQTREFRVVNNRPQKIYEETEDATIPEEKRIKITTRRFAKGRWRTTVKYIKRVE